MFIRVTLLTGEVRLVNVVQIKQIGKGLDPQRVVPPSRIFLTGHPASFFDVEEPLDVIEQRIDLCLN